MTYPYLKRLPSFEYLAPKTIKEALDLLAQYGNQAKLLAGGTDLLMKMKKREAPFKYIIGLKSIPGLDFIAYDDKLGLRFGPLVTIHNIETYIQTTPLIAQKLPILAQAAASLGSVQVRNLATVVGNLCSALPSADMAPGLIVLGASLKLVGRRGERTVTVEEFFHAPGVSALASWEIVTEVQVPNPAPNSGMVYIKHSLRSAMDLSMVGVAALVTLDKNICRDARICLGTVNLTPMRARQCEDILKGQPLDANSIEKAALAASQECNPRTTMRSTAEYRREMVKVLTERALNQIKEKAGLR
jgi:CO/xanthine dehydrogenase FAD-binding subunit